MAEQQASYRDEPGTAPIYITIGPPCCGKTTWIKRQEGSDGEKILDVALDDGRDVYMPVPTRCLLNIDDAGNNINETTKERDDDREILNRKVHGKSLMERIQSDYVELRLVLQRWTGKLSPEDFATAMTKHLCPAFHGDTDVNNTKVETTTISSESIKNWIAAVEDFLDGPPSTSKMHNPPPQETMIFCVESIFRQHPETNRSALQMATELLYQTGDISQHTGAHPNRSAKKRPVAWGNTNSKPRDYATALECAAAQRRPVYFVKEELCLGDNNRGDYLNMSGTDGNKNKKGVDSKGTKTRTSDGTIMPRVSLQTLWLRNLHRYAKTGRYIPAAASELCRQRVDHLCDQAYQNALAKRSAANNSDDSPDESRRREDEFELSIDQSLVALASTRDFRFTMDHNRRITKLYHNRNHNGRHSFGGRGARQRGPRNDQVNGASNGQTFHGQRRDNQDGSKRPRQSEGGQWRPRQRPRWDDGRDRNNPDNTYRGRWSGRGASSRYGGSAGRNAG